MDLLIYPLKMVIFHSYVSHYHFGYCLMLEMPLSQMLSVGMIQMIQNHDSQDGCYHQIHDAMVRVIMLSHFHDESKL